MFRLCVLEDNVRIDPKDLGKPTDLAIEAVLLETFLDKVIPDVGLVVTLYDVLDVGQGTVYHSNGGAHYKVRFSVVAFRPFIGEVLTGVIKDMDEHGITVSLGFFEDVHVGSEMLLAPAQWQESAAEWLWTQDDSPPLYYQRGAKIRFRVHAVRFRGLPSLVEQAAQRERGEAVEGTEGRPHVPMAIEGRADAQGLGMVNWNWS